MVNDSGGSAFPFEEKNDDGTHYHSEPGMTLRDYLAAKAMHARAINLGKHFHDGEKEVLRCLAETAKRAYQMADAMLEARKQ